MSKFEPCACEDENRQQEDIERQKICGGRKWVVEESIERKNDVSNLMMNRSASSADDYSSGRYRRNSEKCCDAPQFGEVDTLGQTIWTIYQFQSQAGLHLFAKYESQNAGWIPKEERNSWHKIKQSGGDRFQYNIHLKCRSSVKVASLGRKTTGSETYILAYFAPKTHNLDSDFAHTKCVHPNSDTCKWHPKHFSLQMLAVLVLKQEANSEEATGGSPSSCPPGAGDLE